MERTLYFLPRPKKLDGVPREVALILLISIASGVETDMDVDLEMMWDEIDGNMGKNRITHWALQEVKRKYAFEVPDVPVEAEWLEVTYGFNCKCFIEALPLSRGVRPVSAQGS